MSPTAVSLAEISQNKVFFIFNLKMYFQQIKSKLKDLTSKLHKIELTKEVKLRRKLEKTYEGFTNEIDNNTVN